MRALTVDGCRHRAERLTDRPGHVPPASGTGSCPASPTLQHWLCAPATRESFSGAGGAGSTRPPGSSTSAVSPGSPATLPWPIVRQLTWARSPHTAAQPAPESSAPSPGQLAVRGPPTEPVNDPAIPVLAYAQQHPPHLAVGSFQPLRGLSLRQMLLLHLMQYFQPVPFSLAQLDALRFHWPPGHP